jgi:hypothetical protein
VVVPEPDAGPDVTVDVAVDVTKDRDVSHPDNTTPDVVGPEAGREGGMDAEAGRDADADVRAADSDADVVDGGDADSPDVDADNSTTDGNDASDSTGPDVEGGLGTDITLTGTAIAFFPTSDLGLIDDGVFPPVGSTNDVQTEWDSQSGNVMTDDWVGYSFSSPQTFGGLVFQAGIQFGTAGGWFNTLNVQVLRGGVWTTIATGADSSPPYPGNDMINFETYTFVFPTAITGTGIRLEGVPGGTATFISVGELRVYSP